MSQERLEYDTKISDCEGPMVDLWRTWSTASLPLLPDLLRLRVVVPVRIPSMSEIETI